MPYKYTKYYPNGDEESFVQEHKMSLKELQDAVGGNIEIIPHDYFAHQKWGKCIVFGYEEARLEKQPVNPFFKELAKGWNVLGVCIKEQFVPKGGK